LISSNWIAFLLTLVIAVAWLRLVDFAAVKGLFNARTSRKIIHIGTGPIFVLCWLLFSDNPSARYFAAVVPLGISIQFLLIGLGVLKDDASVQAMSRNGHPSEILRGPLIYGIVFVIVTILYWKNPIGIIALMILCGGDGLADIVGQHTESALLPWSKKKTLFGSAAVFFGGVIFSLVILWIYSITGSLQYAFTDIIIPVIVISLLCMLVESLPFADIDNATVPLAAILLGHLIIG
jgi:phytol kinase